MRFCIQPRRPLSPIAMYSLPSGPNWTTPPLWLPCICVGLRPLPSFRKRPVLCSKTRKRLSPRNVMLVGVVSPLTTVRTPRLGSSTVGLIGTTRSSRASRCSLTEGGFGRACRRPFLRGKDRLAPPDRSLVKMLIGPDSLVIRNGTRTPLGATDVEGPSTATTRPLPTCSGVRKGVGESLSSTAVSSQRRQTYQEQ